jgi:hypothetical protein
VVNQKTDISEDIFGLSVIETQPGAGSLKLRDETTQEGSDH